VNTPDSFEGGFTGSGYNWVGPTYVDGNGTGIRAPWWQSFDGSYVGAAASAAAQPGAIHQILGSDLLKHLQWWGLRRL
jgi:hypothetical protein